MIEKMKFVSISGPKNDLDRMVNQYLSHYEIQLENALTELRSASKLEPYPGTNPYREPLQKAQKLLASCPGAKQQEISTGTMPVENAITLVNDMDTELAASDEERESLKAKEKEVSSLLEQVRLYVELDFDIPAILKLKHIKYRFGRIRKESFPQLQAFADRSDETILFKPLTKDNIGGIIHLIIADLNKRLEDKQLTIRLSDEAMQYIVDNAYDPVYGARPLKRYIQKYVETLAAKMILADQVDEGDTIVITVEDDKLSAKCEKGSKNK